MKLLQCKLDPLPTESEYLETYTKYSMKYEGLY